MFIVNKLYILLQGLFYCFYYWREFYQIIYWNNQLYFLQKKIIPKGINIIIILIFQRNLSFYI
jgi:hypothetical protein